MKYPNGKCFAPLRMQNLLIKFFGHSFVDIALTFFVSLFNSFLFEVTVFRFSLKSVFLTKLAITFLLVTFACFGLAVKYSDLTY